MNKRQVKKYTKKQIKALEEAVKEINSVDWQRVGEIIVEGTKEVLKEFELYMKELAEGDKE